MTRTAIHVTFMDSATGRILGRSDLPIDQLPESFEAPTTLHLGAQDWQVEKAEPMRAEEFRRTGTLTLTLRQVSYVDPRKILFTLPTLEAVIPHPDERTTTTEHPALELHEDDWRQIEFVSAKYQREVEAELADIATIYRERSVDDGGLLGFRELHMRKRILSPIDPPLTLDDVRTALGVTGPSFAAVSFKGIAGMVPVSFAFQIGDLILYGVYGVDGAGDMNSVRCLCIYRRTTSLPEPVVSRVQRLMSAHKLNLVDWCRMAMLAPDDITTLALYFSGQ